ncbi:MAG: CooT family nickel-binding protein [Deltaproteobacteria bacterium]|nr:CooT family nickel-binding protein [Deltaproteobacteria bacterium]
MCEAAAYILRGGNEELILESVDVLENEDGRIHMVNIFGDQKTLNARIKTLSLVDHKIILEPLD